MLMGFRLFDKEQGTKYKEQGTRYKVQGTRHKAQGARYKAQDITGKIFTRLTYATAFIFFGHYSAK